MIAAIFSKGSFVRGAALFVSGWLAVAAAWALDAHTTDPGPAGWPPHPAAVGSRWMAVTANKYATDTAAEILAMGGSAVDAAIAAQLVLGLVEPQSSGIGGGAFLLHWDAAKKKLIAFDGRETAPAAARAERFSSSDGMPLPFQDVVATGKAVGVPGVVAMLAQAHGKYGYLRWEQLFAPALRLADNGFVISPRLHGLLQADKHLRDKPVARAFFFNADGEPKPAGEVLRNPEYAKTLQAIAAEGPRALYRGPLAARIVATVRENGGDMVETDLAHYRPREREAVCNRYRAWNVCSMPPPSSGGITLLQILGMVERAKPPAAPLDVDAVHVFSEAGRLAFADRARYLADPDFVAVPQAALLAPDYLDRRARLIKPDESMGKAEAGDLPQRQAFADDGSPELPSTSHLAIVDAEGNAVAMTSSVEDAFGSRIMVGGFMLNNQLTDFSFSPTEGGKPAANRVEPGKRPLSSMAPTMVFDADGRLVAVTGSPGGPRIINFVARNVLGVLEWNMPVEQVLAQPHVGSRNGPTEVERIAGTDDLVQNLVLLGHKVSVVDMNSGLHVIVREGDHWRGAADPRREGTARGN